MDSENIEKVLPVFRGVNDKRVSYTDAAGLVVETLDAGLYGQIEPPELSAGRFPALRSNKDFWVEALKGNVGQGDRILLEDFYILEWMPSSPGRFFTEDAAESRRAALQYFSDDLGEYLPLGKYELVLGGVGSLRLAPRDLGGGHFVFLGATSNGVSHQGIPMIVPIESSRQILRCVRTNGFCRANVQGTLWPLPLERSPVVFTRGTPRLILFPARITVSAPRGAPPLVSVAVSYSADYEGEEYRFPEMTTNVNKNWTFASFNPAAGFEALQDAVRWLKRYAERYSRQTVWVGNRWREIPKQPMTILGDFDEHFQHFEFPIEFPLRDSLKKNYSRQFLDLYGSVLHLKINKAVMGDSFENIQGSVVSRSTLGDVTNSFNQRFGADLGSDLGDALKKIAEMVEKSDNAAAASIYKGFSSEVEKDKPNAGVLQQCWNGILAILPSAAKVADSAAKIIDAFS